MSWGDRAATAREIAVALVGVLHQALADDAARSDLVAARDASQLLDLPGLDGVLEACQPHLGRPRPAELTPVIERVRRLALEAIATDAIEPFRRADRELAALAAELQSLEWSESAAALEGRAPAVPTLSLADVLEDQPLVEPDSGALRVRLTAHVAAAVRAALDWLAPARAPLQPLHLRSEESALEIGFDSIAIPGLVPADRVLSAVGGVLGPAAPGTVSVRGGWMLRVPIFSGRSTYLMLNQGSLRLALPWHSVLRLCLVPASGLHASLRDAGHTVLDPIMPLGRAAPEYPIVLVGHGLKRAYLVADRLVWRLRAHAADESRATPSGVLSHAVETDEGEVYWAVEPGRLLERIAAPVYEAPPEEEPELPTLGPENVEPLPDEAPPASEPAAEPLAGPALSEASAAPAAAATETPVNLTATAPAAEAGPIETPRRSAQPGLGLTAIVAEDSITARVFLVRLLEQQGFRVRSAVTAPELEAALAEEEWSLLCVDVELPGASPTGFAPGLFEARRRRGPLGRVVALVRDAADAAVAAVAGIERTLEKPFDREAIEGLLAELEFEGGEGR